MKSTEPSGQSAPGVRRNGIDDKAEAIFATLQSRVELAQALGGVVEDLPEVSQFIFPSDRYSVLKLAPRQCLGAFHQSRQWLGDAAGNGQAEGSGDQQREDCGQRHNHKNKTLRSPNVQHGLGLLFAGLVVDFLDELRGQRFQWPYLVCQAQVHRPPVARCSERSDGLKLRGQRALDNLKGGQDGRIAPGVERWVTKGGRRPTDVLQDRGTK